MTVRVLQAPEQEPLTLAEIKTFLRIDHDLDDQELQAMIIAAREQAELHQGRECARKLLEITMDRWPRGGPILTPSPLASVERIRYRRADGDVVVWPADQYWIVDGAEPGEIHPVSQWPADALWPRAAVIIEAWCGWLAGQVPESVRQGMKLLISSWYENRTGLRWGQVVSEIPMGVTALLSAGRLVRF